MKFAVTVAAAVLALPVWTQTVDRAEVALQGALKKETVDGDLKGAIEAYRKVALSYRGNRAVVAKALVRVGQCYEKLGDAESRKAYEQVVREFGDQAEAVATARTRLAALTPKAKQSGITLRRVFEDVVGPKVAVSPDGRWLVHSPRGGYRLRDNTTGLSRQLTHLGRGESLAVHDEAVFTTDSRQVAYVVQTNDGVNVRVISVDGSGERTVFRNSHPLQLSGWFPDSARLLVQTAVRDEPVSLYAVSIADGSTKLIKRGEGNLGGAWLSADGKLVAYRWQTKPGPNETSIRILSLEDMTDVAVVEHPSGNWAPRFAPQNKGIVFKSNRRGTNDLWYQPLSAGRPSGPPELLTKADIGTLQEPAGMTNDGTLYFRGRMEMLDSYIGEFDPATGKWVSPPRKLSLRSTGQTASPAFSADGQWVAYTRTPTAGQWNLLSLFLQSLTTGDEREIPTDLGWVEWQWWFPDGKSLLVQGQAFDNPRYGIYRFDLATRRSTFLRGSSREWANFPSMDRDGKTVYLPLRARLGRIIAWNTETGVERDLVIGDELSGISLSPDGRSIAFVRSEGQTRILETIGTDGNGRRELYRSQVQPDGFGGIWTPTWLQDGRSIMFNSPTRTGWWPAGIQRISAEGGAPRSIGLSAENTEADGKRIAWPVLHTDGRHVAFNAGNLREECYALENFLPLARAAR
jgi:Tol biopolymer transport system component